MVLLDQSEIGLMDQCGRLQRMSGALTAEMGRRASPQLVIYDGQQPVSGLDVPGRPGPQ
jgi:hypothetical protein